MKLNQLETLDSIFTYRSKKIMYLYSKAEYQTMCYLINNFALNISPYKRVFY